MASVRLTGGALPSRGRREDVEVGRRRLDPARLAQREIDGPAVGRESDLLAAAERLGRRVADQAAGQRHAGAGQLAAGDREGEQARLRTPGSAQVSQWRMNSWS